MTSIFLFDSKSLSPFNSIFKQPLPFKIHACSTVTTAQEPETTLLSSQSPLISTIARNEMIAGSVAAAVGYTSCHPLDLIKTRIQMNPTLPPWKCAVDTFKVEGFRGLFKGYFPPLWGQIATNLLLFPVNELCNRFWDSMNETPDSLTYSQIFASGVIAGTAAMIITQPTELLKCRLQVQNMGKLPMHRLSIGELFTRWKTPISQFPTDPKISLIGHPNRYYGSMDACIILTKRYGVKSLTRGMLCTWLRDISFGVYFLTYSGTKDFFDYLFNQKKSDDYPLWQLFIAGAMAGSATWASTWPLDVVCTRIRCAPEAEFGKKTPSIKSILTKIYRNEGWRVLFTGLGVNTLRTIPFSGISMMVYELTKKNLELYW